LILDFQSLRIKGVSPFASAATPNHAGLVRTLENSAWLPTPISIDPFTLVGE